MQTAQPEPTTVVSNYSVLMDNSATNREYRTFTFDAAYSLNENDESILAQWTTKKTIKLSVGVFVVANIERRTNSILPLDAVAITLKKVPDMEKSLKTVNIQSHYLNKPVYVSFDEDIQEAPQMPTDRIIRTLINYALFNRLQETVTLPFTLEDVVYDISFTSRDDAHYMHIKRKEIVNILTKDYCDFNVRETVAPRLHVFHSGNHPYKLAWNVLGMNEMQKKAVQLKLSAVLSTKPKIFDQILEDEHFTINYTEKIRVVKKPGFMVEGLNPIELKYDN